MATFQELPVELIERILVELDPVEVASVAQCCRLTRSIVYEQSDQYFWRSLFLAQLFDDPRECTSLDGTPYYTEDFNWADELKRRIRARTIVKDATRARPEERLTILKTLLSMVVHTPPASPAYNSSEISRNLIWMATVLRQPSFFDLFAKEVVHMDEPLLVAQLHTYYGASHKDLASAEQAIRRAEVYDLRNYDDSNDWGPFIPGSGGAVNWLRIRAIQNIMSSHVVNFNPDTGQMPLISPLSLPFCQTQMHPPCEESSTSDVDDWAGVEGYWQCSFCFCDHRDLIAFNSTGRGPSFFSDPTFREEFRTINLRLKVVSNEADPRFPHRPKLSIAGTIDGIRHMRGSVSMTPDRQVRWQFESGESGHYMWSSEGVQIGSVQSAFGVLGIWTTVFHDQLDPVGPFWLRKLPRDTIILLDSNNLDEDLN